MDTIKLLGAQERMIRHCELFASWRIWKAATNDGSATNNQAVCQFTCTCIGPQEEAKFLVSQHEARFSHVELHSVVQGGVGYVLRDDDNWSDEGSS